MERSPIRRVAAALLAALVLMLCATGASAQAPATPAQAQPPAQVQELRNC